MLSRHKFFWKISPDQPSPCFKQRQGPSSPGVRPTYVRPPATYGGHTRTYARRVAWDTKCPTLRVGKTLRQLAAEVYTPYDHAAFGCIPQGGGQRTGYTEGVLRYEEHRRCTPRRVVRRSRKQPGVYYKENNNATR